MTRLINADAVRDKLQKEIDKASPPFDNVIGSIRCGVRLARNIVEDEPTIDAVPIIRCRDCRYSHIYYAWGEEMCKCDSFDKILNSDGFCAWAEQKG